MTRADHQILLITACIFCLMLPVTGMVPVFAELTSGRYSGLPIFDKHLFMSANMVGALLFVPVAGVLSDRLGHRRFMIAGAFAVNAAALWMMQGDWSYPLYLGLRFIEGCAHITSLSLLMTLAMDQARHVGSGRSMGLTGMALTLGVALGAPVGGIVGETDALDVFFYGAFLMGALAILSGVLLRDLPEGMSRPGLHGLASSLIRTRLLAVPYAFTFVDRLTVGFIVSTLSLYMGSVLGFGPREIGIAMMLFMLPFAVLTFPSALLARRFDPFAMMLTGSFLYGLVLMGMGFSDVESIDGLMLAGGVVAALMFAPSLVMVTRLADPLNRATAMAGFNLAGSLGFLLGPLLGGTLLSIFSGMTDNPYGPTFLVAGMLEIGCVLLFLPWLRNSRTP